MLLSSAKRLTMLGWWRSLSCSHLAGFPPHQFSLLLTVSSHDEHRDDDHGDVDFDHVGDDFGDENGHYDGNGGQ